MLKKLLYLYNDGHNPFPHLRGKGLHLIDDKYEYDNKPDDTQVYDGGFITGNYVPVGDDKFRITDEYGNVMDVDRDKPIEPPDYYKNLTSQEDYALDDDDDRFYNEENYDDEILETINENINEFEKQAKNIIGSEYKDIKDFDEKNKIKYDILDSLSDNLAESKKELQKLQTKYIKLNYTDMGLAHEIIRANDLYSPVLEKITKKLLNLNDENELTTEIIKNELSKYSKVLKTSYETLIYGVAYAFLQMAKIHTNQQVKDTTKGVAGLLLLSISKDSEKSNTLINDIKKTRIVYNQKIREYDKIVDIAKEYNIVYTKIESLKKQYAERKKILDQRKRLTEIKELYKTNPEQAAKDALELNAELKEKEALAQGKQLSKAAQKKANAAAKKAAAEKQAESPVVNAHAALKSTGTYGKKLEDFFTGGGQPILQKFTGDKSKIHDIEKGSVIPDEDVTFDDKTVNSLRKACTLDLYNDKFVFEIKNYVNNSINDDVIPMQPSKFAGTKYFVPTYLENGRLFSLNLNYDSPKTGIKHRENILPPNPEGYEVVFIIRLKEGLFQYKPFLDKENNKLIPNGEFASGKRPLYFFDYTNLKPCLDYNEKKAFNLKGHLDPI